MEKLHPVYPYPVCVAQLSDASELRLSVYIDSRRPFDADKAAGSVKAIAHARGLRVVGFDFERLPESFKSRPAKKPRGAGNGDLLKAAKAVLEWSEFMGGWNSPIWDDLKSAVAKTEGA